MKITKVKANNHKHAFEVSTRSGDYLFPYSRAESVPSTDNPIVELYVDPELANEGFTFKLESGTEDSVLMDHVLDYNADPEYVSEMDVHNLTVAAKRRFESSGLSVREIARRMRTSPTQVYRLLDTTNHNKTMKQMLAFLRVLGFQPRVMLEPLANQISVQEAARQINAASAKALQGIVAAMPTAQEQMDSLTRLLDAERLAIANVILTMPDRNHVGDLNEILKSMSTMDPIVTAQAAALVAAGSSGNVRITSGKSGVYRSKGGDTKMITHSKKDSGGTFKNSKSVDASQLATRKRA